MSRRKQLKPKSLRGGGLEEPALPTPARSNSQDFSDDEDAGFRPLIINTDDTSDITSIPEEKTIPDPALPNTADSESNKLIHIPTPRLNPRPVLNTLSKNNHQTETASFQRDPIIPEPIPELTRASSVTSGGVDIYSGYLSNGDVTMTQGGMEYASDDSHSGSVGVAQETGKFIVTPAVYRSEQNTPIAKPRFPTPSKTRRKSDKIVPVVTAEGQKFICPVCKIGLSSDNELTAHIRSHNTTSAVNTCTICGKVLSSQSSLDRHMLVHSGERPFRCKICDMSFTTNGNMHRHSRIHQKEDAGSPSAIARTSTPASHSGDSSKKSRRVRPTNMMSFGLQAPTVNTGGIKRKHSSDNESEMSHGFLLGVESQENSHREYAEQNAMSPDKAASQHEEDSDTLCCPVCMKTFLCKYGLDTHFASHENEPGTCQICQLSMPSSKLVYLHYFIAHVDRKKLKEFAQFSKNNNSKNIVTPLSSGFHELSFTDFSTEKFTQIAKVWSEKNQRRSNSYYQDFHCRKCDHAFPSADALRLHNDTHPNVCDVTCNSCDVSFVTKQEFEDHMIKHSGDKIIDGFSKKHGTDDNDIQDMLSQPEFLLCLGLKSKKDPLECCNVNTIERAASKYENTIAAPIQSKPVNHVTPIVIQPEGDLVNLPHLTRCTQGPVNKQDIPHPAFPAHVPTMPKLQPRAPVTGNKTPVEISSSSDGEGEAETEINIDVKSYQCVICEFAFSNLSLCERHCRNDHGLTQVQELHGAIKHNPFSGQRRINPDLQLMPYLCKKCTNGFSNKENCIQHLQCQHVCEGNILQYIATNKKLNEKTMTLQPSYLAGVKDALMLKHRGQGQNLTTPTSMGSIGSAFTRTVPTIQPVSALQATLLPLAAHLGNSNATIRTPLFPPAATHVKQEPSTPVDDDQPLDFSMKRSSVQPQDFSRNSAAQIPTPVLMPVDPDMPMDLSTKRPRDGATAVAASSRVAPQNVVSMSASMSCALLNPATTTTTKHVNVRPASFTPLPAASLAPPTAVLGPRSATSNAVRALTGPLSVQRSNAKAGARFSAPLPQQQRLQGTSLAHARLQQFYIPALGKFQCVQCRLLFKTSFQLGTHLDEHHNPQRPLYRCKHCPAMFPDKPGIEQHILTAHSQIHAPLLIQTQPQLPASAQSSPAMSQRDLAPSPGLNYSSDSDLSSVTKMIDCASKVSKFGAFAFGGANDSLEQVKPTPIYMHTGNTNPMYQNDTRNQPMESHGGNSGIQDSSLNTSPDASNDEPPAKKKRNSYSDSPHKLQCPYCPRAFPWISSLRRHILTHTGQKPFKCPECPVTFSTKSNRERHMARKHGLDINDRDVRASMETPYRCQICGSSFPSAGSIKLHYKETHEGTHIPDYIIQQAKFEQLSSSQSQQDKRLDGQVEAMSDVSDMTSSLRDFDEEEDEEFDGERMQKVVTSAFSATPSPTPISASVSPAPSVVPMETQPVLDDEAPEYLTKINPERDNYNVDRITGCWKCGVRFESRKILLRHLKDHNIDHSFKCYLCDASFESRMACLEHTETVHRHDWVLLREKNKCYNIEEYASGVEAQVLETLANLGLNADGEEIEGAPKPDPDDKSNADSDYAQRKVFCSFCVKRFWSLQDLRRHMRSHTGERPFECDICQKRFTLKHSMMRHRRKHSANEIAAAASNVRSTSPNAQSDDETHTEEAVHQNGVPAAAMNMSYAPNGMMGSLAQSSSLLSSYAEMFGAGESGNSDLLNNLLGMDSSQIDEMIRTKDAARMLALGEK